jgi:hypothetical protein
MQYGDTAVNSITLAFTLVLGLLILGLRPKLTLAPLLLGAVCLPFGVSVTVGPFHFFMLRLLVLFGWLRVLKGVRYKLGKLQALDVLVMLFVVSELLVYTVLWQTTSAIVGRLGLAFDAIGLYFVFRRLLKDAIQPVRTVKVLAIIAVVIAVCVVIEHVAVRNPFSVFGGVSPIPEIRGGRIRCQGPFAHSILAGTFGATLFPAVVSLWWRPGSAIWAVIGGAASVIIVLSSSSSGPILTLIAALAGLFMWPLRTYMRLIRWLAGAALISLQLIMNGPVWALIGKAAVFGSSSSDHRYELVDHFIRHADQWWLLGIKSTTQWGWGMQDISNNYVRVGVDGGALSLLLFISIIVVSFKVLGRKLHAAKHIVATQRLIWGLGVSLFSHMIAFLGVSYWDQSIVIWYLLLALIASVEASGSTATTPHLESSPGEWERAAEQPVFGWSS